MKKHLRLLTILLSILTIIGVFSITASALVVDSGSGGGETGNSQTASGGYSISGYWATDSGNPKTVFGLRFSVYNIQTKESTKSIDVYRDMCPGATTYAKNNRFGKKLNHKQLSDEWGTYKLETISEANDLNYFFDWDGLGIELPATTDGIEEYIKNDDATLDAILSKIDGRLLSELGKYDRILIEPIFPITLDGESINMTVGEIAAYGAGEFGLDVAVKSDGEDGSWAYIADYTNRLFPNSVFTPDGSGVFSATSEIPNKTYATFRTILNQGYGTAIAYNEAAVNSAYTLTVNYYSNYADKLKGNSISGQKLVKTETYTADQKLEWGLHNYTSSDNEIFMTRTGYSAKTINNAGGEWNTKEDGSGKGVGEDAGFSSGADLAKALGVDLSKGDEQDDL